MNLNQSQSTRRLVEAAMIAAIYTVLTLLASAMGIAFAGVQFRFSEALTVLPVFTPAAIPGLTLGCLLSNIIGSPFGILDWVCGTAASLLAAVLTRLVRHITIKGLPVLAPLPPVLTNAVIIGAMISYTMPEGFTMAGFWASALSVGIGQFIVCYALGLPLIFALQKTGAAKKVFG